jgi:hypothetical protein
VFVSFPFIRFTNWKQVPSGYQRCERYKVSIHTLHELEASGPSPRWHHKAIRRFPFIRFTNWKQERWCYRPTLASNVSIHTLHELEASLRSKSLWGGGQGGLNCFHSYASRIGSKRAKKGSRSFRKTFPFIRFTNWKQEEVNITFPFTGGVGFHSYASRIGSKSPAPVHPKKRTPFPFIRFTNWKQGD